MRFSFKSKYIIICPWALQKLFTGSENNPNPQIFHVGEGTEVLKYAAHPVWHHNSTDKGLILGSISHQQWNNEGSGIYLIPRQTCAVLDQSEMQDMPHLAPCKFRFNGDTVELSPEKPAAPGQHKETTFLAGFGISCPPQTQSAADRLPAARLQALLPFWSSKEEGSIFRKLLRSSGTAPGEQRRHRASPKFRKPGAP